MAIMVAQLFSSKLKLFSIASSFWFYSSFSLGFINSYPALEDEPQWEPVIFLILQVLRPVVQTEISHKNENSIWAGIIVCFAHCCLSSAYECVTYLLNEWIFLWKRPTSSYSSGSCSTNIPTHHHYSQSHLFPHCWHTWD